MNKKIIGSIGIAATVIVPLAMWTRAGLLADGFDVGQGFLGLGLGCLGLWMIVKAFGWNHRADQICGLLLGSILFVSGAYTLAGAAL